jgi:hypothetical protein
LLLFRILVHRRKLEISRRVVDKKKGKKIRENAEKEKGDADLRLSLMPILVINYDSQVALPDPAQITAFCCK